MVLALTAIAMAAMDAIKVRNKWLLWLRGIQDLYNKAGGRAAAISATGSAPAMIALKPCF
jgi:hypothetical protein